MVPANWSHPKNESGRYIPLHDSYYEDAVRDWETDDLPKWIEGARLWAIGLAKNYEGGTKTIQQAIEDAKANRPYSPPPEHPTYEWWAGDVPSKPSPDEFMPNWSEAERTHFMMYEDTSEGTPISPAFATAEELARWLADTGASAFADMTATYEQWLSTIRRGSACSAVISDGHMMSGVEVLA